MKRLWGEIVSMTYKAIGAAVITEATSILNDIWHLIYNR